MNVQSTPTSRPASPDNTSAVKKGKCGGPQATLLFGEQVNKQLPEPDISDESAHQSHGALSKTVEKTAVVEPGASLQASKSPPLSEQRSQQARAFYRSCHPLDPVPNPEKPVARDYPTMRSWLQDFSQEGKDAVVQLDNMVANGEPYIQEALFLATARVMEQANALDIGAIETIQHNSQVTSAYISPDGHYLLSAALDGNVALAERVNEQWQVLRQIKHGGGVTCARFSPCSRYFFTSSQDHSARIYQRAGAKWHLQTIISHPESVKYVCCSADSQRIATASGFDEVQIWAQSHGQFHHQDTIQIHTDIQDVSFTADGDHLLVQATSGEGQLWRFVDNQRWERQQPIPSLDRMYNCKVSPDGQHLIASAKADQGTRIICRFIDGQWQKQQSFESYTEPRFSADGTMFVCTDNRAKEAQIWQYRNQKWEQVATLLHLNRLERTNLSPDGKRLLTIGKDGSFTFFENSDERGWLQRLHVLAHPRACDSCFSSDGRHCMVVAESSLFIWANSGSCLKQKVGIEYSCRIHSARFSPNGDSIVLIDHNQKVSVFKLKSKEGASEGAGNVIQL